jgi:hypothetical protein
MHCLDNMGRPLASGCSAQPEGRLETRRKAAAVMCSRRRRRRGRYSQMANPDLTSAAATTSK